MQVGEDIYAVRRTMCAVAPSTFRTVHYALYIPVGLCLCDEMCLKVSFLLFRIIQTYTIPQDLYQLDIEIVFIV